MRLGQRWPAAAIITFAAATIFDHIFVKFENKAGECDILNYKRYLEDYTPFLCII